MEKNAKAKQLILNGLTRGDMDKVMHLKYAQDIWKEIQVIHAGSKDHQELIRHDLLTEFLGFVMQPNESVSAYHSRFQTLIDRMHASKVNMDHLNPSLSFIRGVDSLLMPALVPRSTRSSIRLEVYVSKTRMVERCRRASWAAFLPRRG